RRRGAAGWRRGTPLPPPRHGVVAGARRRGARAGPRRPAAAAPPRDTRRPLRPAGPRAQEPGRVRVGPSRRPVPAPARRGTPRWLPDTALARRARRRARGTPTRRGG